MHGATVTAAGRSAATRSLDTALAETARAVDVALERLLPAPAGAQGRVAEAMRYAVFAGGKRLRPFLVLSSTRLFDVPESRAVQAAAAIEVLHTYSLVHDDLPCMDDDDVRRGRPTTHKAFDEATAVLAGDGLLTLAFEILSQPQTHPSAEVRIGLVRGLAEASGAAGMVGGQMIDMQAPSQDYGLEQIIDLQRLKTGALFEFAAAAGAILGEAADADAARLRGFARDFGLVFQITDDLLDAAGTAEEVGKAVGKDDAQGKATLVSIYGLEGARLEAERLAEQAIGRLSAYDGRADELRALTRSLLDRRK